MVLRLALLAPGRGYLLASYGLVGDLEPAHEYRETRLRPSVIWDVLSALGGLGEVPLQRGVT